MSNLDGVDISELFEVPDELKNKIKNTKNKKPISDERREALKLQLARGRETARKNREAKLGNSTKVAPKPKTPEPEVEPDSEVDTTATETHSDIEPEIKKKENQKKLGGMIARSKKSINELVEEKVNQKFKLLAEAVENRRKEKKVSIVEPPKKPPTVAPEVISTKVNSTNRPKVIRRAFKKYPWEQ